jgi:glycosyltransferase involved in cell wall biosynthesis
LKILRIIARLNVGGPARHVALLNDGLQRRGHGTLLVFGALDTGEASLEGPARELGIPMLRVPDLGRSVRVGSDLRAFVALVRVMFRERPDVVHTHTAKAGTLGRLAALVYNGTRRKSRRALIVHTFHGHVLEGYFSTPINRLVRAAERWLARISDRIVTISPRQRHDIVERFAVAPAAKTSVVPLGLDLDALLSLDDDMSGLRGSIGAATADVVVGYVGRMVPVKDLDTLVRAFAQACAAVPSLRLVLAGDGPERAQTEKLAEELGVAGRVHFLGWVSNLAALYATIDLFALSSVNEGTPVAAIEAMAAARAVVATSVGGVPDVVDPGVTGLLVPARDAGAMSAALIALAADRERRAVMGRAGRERARARYSYRRLVDDIEQLYVTELQRKRTA